jgi:hypothetical protein
MTLLHSTTAPLGKGTPQTNGGRRGRPVVPRQTIPGAALDNPALSPETAAIIAACLVRGLVLLGHLTPTQALCLTGANETLFHLVNEFSTAELDAVASGKLSIDDVIAARRAEAWRVVDMADRLIS